MAESITPMVKQYQEIKSQYKDAILFFRLGDFYEMFNEDARVASRELELTLTGRGEGEGRMPMCGIPYHAATNYVSKLIDRGYKVAICDQVEDPKLAKGIVRREVVKLLTPGTVQEEKMLDARSSNYLLALSFNKHQAGLAYIDASTGEFKATQFDVNKEIDKLFDEINRISPSEILVPDIVPDLNKGMIDQLKSRGYSLTTYKDIYDEDTAQSALLKHFEVRSLDSFGLQEMKAVLGPSIAIIDYLKQTQKGGLRYINKIQPYTSGDFMFIDASSRRNLELICVIKDQGIKGSLLWVLDKTSTPMGGRLLKKWLLQPQININEINERADVVEALFKAQMLRDEIVQHLRSVFDIERVVGRIASGSCSAKDLIALKESLLFLPKIKNSIKDLSSTKINELKKLPEMNEVIDLITKAIENDPPFTLKDGGLIKKGYNKELDELKELTSGGKEWITQLELKERQRTGIKSLKVGYTSVFGYYIEVSKSNLDHIPQDYVRKQTLVNCERYITPELKDKEAMILNAEEKMFKMEHEIFNTVREGVSTHTKELQHIAAKLAEFDVLTSLAMVAAENRYCRPKVISDGAISIKQGRHPVVERTLGNNMFVPNDTFMEHDKSRFLLITGPNMAGKSTYMRQVAHICLMAQIGSFVPADEADLPLIDRIFTRIGAMDDIFSGQSTFMVEMTETANIINNATDKSLVILDEIGRGTSTFDGMSIAASVAEYINNKIKAFALFATHYHEITQLADKSPGMKNFNTLVKKEGDSVIFMHKIVEGAADQSYGIEVAKLAGLPQNVIARAKEIYDKLEMVESDLAGTKHVSSMTRKKDQMGLF